MEIRVKPRGGAALLLVVEPSDTIQDVKAHIEEAVGTPADEQELAFDGRPLSNLATVGGCDIKDGSVLALTRREGEDDVVGKLGKLSVSGHAGGERGHHDEGGGSLGGWIALAGKRLGHNEYVLAENRRLVERAVQHALAHTAEDHEDFALLQDASRQLLLPPSQLNHIPQAFRNQLLDALKRASHRPQLRPVPPRPRKPKAKTTLPPSLQRQLDFVNQAMAPLGVQYGVAFSGDPVPMVMVEAELDDDLHSRLTELSRGNTLFKFVQVEVVLELAQGEPCTQGARAASACKPPSGVERGDNSRLDSNSRAPCHSRVC